MKLTHEQKMKKRAKARRQTEAAERRQRAFHASAQAAGLSDKDYGLMSMMRRILG